MRSRADRYLQPFLTWAGWALAAALISVGVEGFSFGDYNNVFQVPVVLELYDQPQFASNAFYQSLRDYTSGFWILLRPFATEGTIEEIFFVAHVVTRWLLLVSLGGLAAAAGVRGKLRIPLFYLVIIGTGLLGADSILAGHDVFHRALSHTALANGLAIASVTLMSVMQPLFALPTAGLAFDVNAFVGVWLIVPLCVLFLHQMLASEAPRQVVRQFALGGTVAVFVALPVAVWILQVTVAGPSVEGWSFRSFLFEYVPDHTFVTAQEPSEIVALFLLFICASATVHLSLSRRRSWRLVLVSLMALFLIGAVPPEITDSPLLLNLYLLRTDGLIQFITVTLLAASALNLLDAPEPEDAAAGVALLSGLALGSWHLVTIAVAIVAASQSGSRTPRYLWGGAVLFSVVTYCWLGTPAGYWQLTRAAALVLAGATLVTGLLSKSGPAAVLGVAFMSAAGGASPWPMLAGVAPVLALLLWNSWDVRMTQTAGVLAVAFALLGAGMVVRAEPLIAVVILAQSIGVGLIAARNRLPERLRRMSTRFWRSTTTLAVALFLILLLVDQARSHPSNPRDEAWEATQRWARSATPESAQFLVPLRPPGFQLGSRRAIWVDWKQGAAVMWQPSFYRQWKSRYDDVGNLERGQDFIRYACAHGLEFAVVPVERITPALRDSSYEPAYANEFYAVFSTVGRICEDERFSASNGGVAISTSAGGKHGPSGRESDVSR